MGFGERVKAAAMAALGSERAKGQLDVMNTVSTLRGEYERYIGSVGLERTPESVCEYVAQYGVPLDPGATPTAVMSRAQVDELLTIVARAMIKNGQVDMEPVNRGPLR